MNARTLFVLPLAFCSGMVMATFAGCSGTNDSHCANKGGDAYCQEKLGLGAGEVFCTNNCGGDYDFDGCLVASEPPADGCWLCDGEGSENCDGMAEGSGTETATESATDTTASETASETTAESSTTEGPECMDSSMCGGETPLCEDGACVACGAGVMTNCASEYPETPACDATGACVECTSEDAAACGGMTPVCEGNVCVACDEHEQCPESACNMSTGACMDPARVWWVDQSAPAGGDGSEAMPFQTLAAATNLVADGEMGTIYLATPNTHQEYFPVFSGRTIALIGKTDMGSLSFNAAEVVDIKNGATVFLGDLVITNGASSGVTCDNCSLWIHSSSVVDNGADNVVGTGGQVTIVNTFVGGVGFGVDAVAIDGGSVDILYSTLAGGGMSSLALGCQNGASAAVRNSLLVSLQAADELNCPGADISASALEMMVPGNVALGGMPDDTWFENYNAGDFSLTPAAPASIATAAAWMTGDPATDIDGDARPTVDGTPDYAGADIPN